MTRGADPPSSINDSLARRTSRPTDTTAHEYIEIDAASTRGEAVLAQECALALSYDGVAQAVMMVSPSDLDDFALGFSLSNGLVESANDIYAVDISGAGVDRHAAIHISNRAFSALKQQRRSLAGTSGCGLCGVELMAQALPELKPMIRRALPQASHFNQLRERISRFQALARASGAMHAALYVDAQGDIILCREDIGRHNALDKLIGALFGQQIDFQLGFAVVTSRCSLELIQKAIRVGLATLVSLSAPTTLSVEWASRYGLNLIHLPHDATPRIYTPLPARDSA